MKNLLALFLLIPFLAHAATITYPLSEKKGGTGKATYTVGDLLYASGTTALTKRGIGSTNNALIVSGGVPAWGQIALGSAAAVTGTLGATNGGTGTATVTTGDLLYGSASNVWSKLATGTLGDSLLVSSTGIPAWSRSSRNLLLNSNFLWWQRGTTRTFSNTTLKYVADRWAYYVSSGTVSDTVTRVTNVPDNLAAYSIKMQRDSGSSNTASHVLSYAFPSSDSYPMGGKTVTYSFYAKAGADMTGTKTITIYLRTGTGTDQGPGSSWTSEANCISGATIVLTTNWARYSGTCTLGTGINQVGITMSYVPTGTASTDDSWYFHAPMLTYSSVAVAWAPAFDFSSNEFLALQAFYEKSYEPATVAGATSVLGEVESRATGTGGWTHSVKYAVPKIKSPSVTLYSAATGTSGKARDYSGAADVTATVEKNSLTGFTGQVNPSVNASDYGFQWVSDAEL